MRKQSVRASRTVLDVQEIQHVELLMKALLGHREGEISNEERADGIGLSHRPNHPNPLGDLR